MRHLAAETKTPLVDMSPLLTHNPESLFLDAVHPNVLRHALIARALKDITLDIVAARIKN